MTASTSGLSRAPRQALQGTGYLMEESRGNGRVILFADDPNFRLYWDGLARLFANALLLSNSF